jgi:4-alpha-glucanotransferase
MDQPTLNTRSGLLLHPTSLPGPHSFGDVGPDAVKFARFLQDARQGWWQMYPLTAPVADGSPFRAVSAFAGNPSLINIEDLVTAGLLLPSEVREKAAPAGSDFAAFQAFKLRCLDAAFGRFKTQDQSEFNLFKEKNAYWIGDYALFSALRKHYGKKPWTEWPAALKRRETRILEQVKPNLAASIYFFEFVQFVLHRQLAALKDACMAKGIGLLVELPQSIPVDSADVWAHQSYFETDGKGRPVSSGGLAVYRWNVMKDDGYQWWAERFKKTFEVFDVVIQEPWTEGPSADFFHKAANGVEHSKNIAIVSFHQFLNQANHATSPVDPESDWKWRFQWSEVPPSAVETLQAV